MVLPCQLLLFPPPPLTPPPNTGHPFKKASHSKGWEGFILSLVSKKEGLPPQPSFGGLRWPSRRPFGAGSEALWYPFMN